MSLPAAAGWVVAAHLSFLMLLVLVVSLREAMQRDMVAALSCQLAAYGGGVFLMLRRYAPNSRVRDFLGVRPSHWGVYVLALLLGAAATVPADSLFALIERRWPLSPEQMGFTKLFLEAPVAQQWLIALGVVVAGPFVEEVLFRGAIFVPLRKAYSSYIVIVTSALLFALVHPLQQQWAPLFLMGALLGYLRASSGTLWASVLAHAAFNFVSVAQLITLGPAAAEVEVAPTYQLALSAVFGLALWGYWQLVRGDERVIAAREADRAA